MIDANESFEVLANRWFKGTWYDVVITATEATVKHKGQVYVLTTFEEVDTWLGDHVDEYVDDMRTFEDEQYWEDRSVTVTKYEVFGYISDGSNYGGCEYRQIVHAASDEAVERFITRQGISGAFYEEITDWEAYKNYVSPW